MTKRNESFTAYWPSKGGRFFISFLVKPRNKKKEIFPSDNCLIEYAKRAWLPAFVKFKGDNLNPLFIKEVESYDNCINDHWVSEDIKAEFEEIEEK